MVLLAGNVPVFTPAGTEGALVAGCAGHLTAGGLLVAGFQLDRGYSLAAYDDHCRLVGLRPAGRWSTWSKEPFAAGGEYAVSVHRAGP